MTKYEDLRPCETYNEYKARFHRFIYTDENRLIALIELDTGKMVLYNYLDIRFTDHDTPSGAEGEK